MISKRVAGDIDSRLRIPLRLPPAIVAAPKSSTFITKYITKLPGSEKLKPDGVALRPAKCASRIERQRSYFNLAARFPNIPIHVGSIAQCANWSCVRGDHRPKNSCSVWGLAAVIQ